MFKEPFSDVYDDLVAEPCAEPEAGDLDSCKEYFGSDECTKEGIKYGEISMGNEDLIHQEFLEVRRGEVYEESEEEQESTESHLTFVWFQECKESAYGFATIETVFADLRIFR